MWTTLCGINIRFNKGNESKRFILKGPNSLNHWNKENEAFIHKYTSKGKRAGASGCLRTRAQRWCFISIQKKTRWIPTLLDSQDNILPQGLSPPFHFVRSSSVFQRQNKQRTHNFGKGLGETSLKLVRGVRQGSLWKKRWIIQVGNFQLSALGFQWFILLIERKGV